MMMNIVDIQEVRQQIINEIRLKKVLLILGAGFTSQCDALKGNVPSGTDYKKYMIDSVRKLKLLSEDELAQLQSSPFSYVAGVYKDMIENSIRRIYIKEHFTDVKLEAEKRKILEFDWGYIYTLNIDDAIEKNSLYKHVIHINKKVHEDIYNEQKCVIKLHGDVHQYLTYENEELIFSREEYIKSLNKNTALLGRLRHDMTYQNLIYIGCSLTDEIDLLSSGFDIPAELDKTNRYIFCVQKPTTLETINLKNHRITHVVVFDSYEEIYRQLYRICQEAKSMPFDSLDGYTKHSFTGLLESSYEKNIPFLLWGKGLMKRKLESGYSEILLPYFFIRRNIAQEIIKNISRPIQILLGSRCSGKTYILMDLAKSVRNKTVYIFESKDRVNKNVLDTILKEKNVFVLADTYAFNIDQIERIVRDQKKIESNNSCFVIAANKNDRDLSGRLTLLENERTSRRKIDLMKDLVVAVSSSFADDEISRINAALTTCHIGVFRNVTILDNIIHVSRNQSEKNRFSRKKPLFGNEREIAVLISLLINKKIYSREAVQFDFIQEVYGQIKATEPFIDYESSWFFERTDSDNSPEKYVLNAEYWLLDHMQKFAQPDNYDKIIRAYQYLIGRVTDYHGKPQVDGYIDNKLYKNYILFDNINMIFSVNSKKGITLIRKIYESLNSLLSSDPNYMHQYAKCYIRSAAYESDGKEEKIYLERAYRLVNVALEIFQKRYEKNENPKTKISIDHAQYTQAVVLCQIARNENYESIETLRLAFENLYKAVLSSYNSYSYAKKDSINYRNAISGFFENIIRLPNIFDRGERLFSNEKINIVYQFIRGE